MWSKEGVEMKDMPFEKALENLENTVSKLEEGDIPLDALLKKYEEGIKLARMCQEKLEKAREKIDILTKGREGEFIKEDLKEKPGRN